MILTGNWLVSVDPGYKHTGMTRGGELDDGYGVFLTNDQ